MTLIATNVARRNENAFGNRALRAVQAYLAGRRAYARAIQELDSLSARHLADLGISQFDLHAIASDARRNAVAKALAR